MATVRYWSGAWIGGGEDRYFSPGEIHSHVMWGFDLGDSISVTATPMGLSYAGVLSITPFPTLSVEDIQVESDASGNRLYFSVRNCGNTYLGAYSINFGFINS